MKDDSELKKGFIKRNLSEILFVFIYITISFFSYLVYTAIFSKGEGGCVLGFFTFGAFFSLSIYTTDINSILLGLPKVIIVAFILSIFAWNILWPTFIAFTFFSTFGGLFVLLLAIPLTALFTININS